MVRIIWTGIKAGNLTTHQLDKHVEGGRLEVPTWSVGEVLQDVLQAFGLMPKNFTARCTWKVPAALRKLSTAFSSPSAVLLLCLVPICVENKCEKGQPKQTAPVCRAPQC